MEMPIHQIPRIVGILKEIKKGETRVALIPEKVRELVQWGYRVHVERGAGTASRWSDEEYLASGAEVFNTAREVWGSADMVFKIHPPQLQECEAMKERSYLVSLMGTVPQEFFVRTLENKKITFLALDRIPRITRAQSMDVLSSMAQVAGCRAVIEASYLMERFFSGQITAAGKIPPARVLVIGAGVAGLAALGVAKSMGATVRAFDTRSEVKEQIKSMGAEYLELDFHEEGSGQGGYAKTMSPEFIQAEMKLFADQAREVDVIISTALIPGKKAPVLITREMVESMKKGSVVVDMATEQGGNCELSQPDQVVEHSGVHIVGYSLLPSRCGALASQMLSNNIINLFKEICSGSVEKFRLHKEDEIISQILKWEGGVPFQAPPLKVSPAPIEKVIANDQGSVLQKAKNEKEVKGEKEVKEIKTHTWVKDSVWVVGAIFLLIGGRNTPHEFLQHLTVFVLAVMVGWQVVWNVTPSLHTPLMSVTNAISGIIVIGALLQTDSGTMDLSVILALGAIILASINIVGGFLVTQRMLKMFRR